MTTARHNTLTQSSQETLFHSIVEQPSTEILQTELQCLEDIIKDPITANIPEAERYEAVNDAFELYMKTKYAVAPVIAGFADELLHEAGKTTQVIFAARDGLGPYTAAIKLLKKFPEHYKTDPEQLAYAYFTRKLIWSAGRDELREYVTQLGVDVDTSIIVADIGMYGSIANNLHQTFPDVSLRYLISRNESIPGYADDGHERCLQALSDGIIGNPVVHFLEDTFSGRTSSPAKLVRKNGVLAPELIEDNFEPKELLKRAYVIHAFEDYVDELGEPPSPKDKPANIARFDAFLSDEHNFKHLMVPHIKG